ncbi:MAG TPA: hypothetical protein PK095_12790, partial [Myxococcota bacterium]|nr:hypothetical protein [Myxococcota bacterium]
RCDLDCEEVPAFSDDAASAVCVASTCATVIEVSHERFEAGATCRTLCAEEGYSCPFAANVDVAHLRGSRVPQGGDVTIELGCEERYTASADTSLYFASCTCAAGTGVPDPDPDPEPNPNGATIVGIQSSAASVAC